MKKKLIIALGGNALGTTPEEQLDLVKKTAKNIVDLSVDYDIVVTHGNGPQVGMINQALTYAHEEIETPNMPFAECGAMSQGYIGYHLQQAIGQEIFKRGMRKSCVAMVTQVLVDAKDKAFLNPTKPIGSFYTKEEAAAIAKEKGYIFKEDAKRGYRRVVASPEPLKIVEGKVIKELLQKHHIVIAAGGGGVPVIQKRKTFCGVDAVIDKDKTSAQLAIDLKADIFLILTAVPKVSIHFGTKEETPIDMMDVKTAHQYMKNNEFKEGSMLPKVEACLRFVTKRHNGVAIITSLEKVKEALLGKTGTVIVKGGKK